MMRNEKCNVHITGEGHESQLTFRLYRHFSKTFLISQQHIENRYRTELMT